MDLSTVKYIDFVPFLNDTFTVTEAEETIEAVLSEVKNLNTEPSISTEESKCFSLAFILPLNTSLPQKMYQLTHEKLGEMNLFLVPNGPDPVKKGMCYEALFNNF